MQRTLVNSLFFILFSAFLIGCGIGGPGDPDPDVGPPQRDAAVDADTVDAETPTCDNPCGYRPGTCAVEVRPISPEQLRTQCLGETLGQSYVDLRPQLAYEASHVPDAVNVPLENLWDGSGFIMGGGALTSETTDNANPVVFYATAAEDATVQAIATASLGLGYEDVYVLVGHIEAWRAAGYYQDISYQGIVDYYYPPGSGVLIVDNMDAATYATGHIAGALQLDDDDVFYDGELVNGGQALLDLSDPSDDEVLIFYCINSGCEASVALSEAAEILGYNFIFHYKEGLEHWQSKGGPVNTGSSP